MIGQETKTITEMGSRVKPRWRKFMILSRWKISEKADESPGDLDIVSSFQNTIVANTLISSNNVREAARCSQFPCLSDGAGDHPINPTHHSSKQNTNGPTSEYFYGKKTIWRGRLAPEGKSRLVIHEYIVSFVLCWASNETKNNINMWGMCLWLSFDLKSPLIKQ